MNVKAGDLAIIIKSANPINLGKIVKVIRGYGISPTENGRVEYGIGWANHPGLNLWVIEASTEIISENNKYTFTKLPFPDKWLKPISGIPELENIESEELVEH